MSETKHCETCKFWGKPDESAEEFRTCAAVVHDRRDLAGELSSERLTYDWTTDDDRSEILAFRAAHRAVAVDGSGFRAALRARKDFGCVLHRTSDGSTT